MICRFSKVEKWLILLKSTTFSIKSWTNIKYFLSKVWTNIKHFLSKVGQISNIFYQKLDKYQIFSIISLEILPYLASYQSLIRNISLPWLDNEFSIKARQRCKEFTWASLIEHSVWRTEVDLKLLWHAVQT